MRCEECSMLLDDYVERELNAKDTEQVMAHLAACAACASAYQKLTREQNAYAHYLLGVEATPALWNNLQAQIEEEKSVRPLPLLPRIRRWATSTFGIPRLRPLQIAAVTIVAIAAIVGMIKYRTPDETPTHNVVSRQGSDGSLLQPSSYQDSAAAVNDTDDNAPGNNIAKRVGKSRFVSAGKRTGKGRSSFTAFNRTPRFTVPEPAINSHDAAGRNAKEQLMLALRITSTQLYVAQRKIQEEQRRTARPATPVSEPNREMR